MKLPRDVLFHQDLRLMVFRPLGVLDERRIDEIVAFLDKEEARAQKPFDRFSDLSKLDVIDLNYEYVLRVSFHRLLSYAECPPVKSAFYVTCPEAANIVKIHASTTDRSSLHVAMFKDIAVAAKWLCVSVEDLQVGG